MGDTGYRIRRQFLILVYMLVNLIVLCLSLISMLWWLPVRLTVNALAKYLRSDLGPPLTGPSSILAGKSPRSKPHNYVGAYILEGDFELKVSIDLFNDRVLEKRKPNGDLTYPELRQYWTPYFNYYFWKDESDFDVTDHIRWYDYNGDLSLPDPCTEEDYRRVLGGLLAKGWEVGRSPWELLVVKNFISTSPKRSRDTQILVIFRVHHGLGDGYSFLQLFLKDLIQYTGRIASPTMTKLTGWQRCLACLILPVKLLYDLAEMCVDSIDYDNCWRLKNGAKLSRKYYTSLGRFWDVRRVREIKNNYGVSYITVVLAAVAGTLRRVMEDAGQRVPKRMAVAVPLPLPNHPGGLVNHVSSFAIKLPLRMVDPTSRVKEVFRYIRKSKYYMGPWATNLMTRLNYVNTNWMNSTIANNSIGFTVAVSSFPGPEEDFYLLGYKLIDTFFGIGKLPGNAAATITMVTAAGGQRFVMNIDQAVYPSEELLMNAATYFEEEIELLHKASLAMKTENV